MNTPILKINRDELFTLREEVWKDMRRHSLRFGASVYNNAFELRPLLVRPLAGSTVDPFYNDSKVEAFLNEICDTKAKDYIKLFLTNIK